MNNQKNQLASLEEEVRQKNAELQKMQKELEQARKEAEQARKENLPNLYQNLLKKLDDYHMGASLLLKEKSFDNDLDSEDLPSPHTAHVHLSSAYERKDWVMLSDELPSTDSMYEQFMVMSFVFPADDVRDLLEDF